MGEGLGGGLNQFFLIELLILNAGSIQYRANLFIRKAGAERGALHAVGLWPFDSRLLVMEVVADQRGPQGGAGITGGGLNPELVEDA